MNLVLVDAEEDHARFAAKAKHFVDAFFFPALEREEHDGVERFAMHALHLCELLVDRAWLSQDGTEALRDARLVIGEVAFERHAPHALLGHPHVPQQLTHRERPLFRPPVEVFGANQSRDLEGSPRMASFCLRKKSFRSIAPYY